MGTACSKDRVGYSVLESFSLAIPSWPRVKTAQRSPEILGRLVVHARHCSRTRTFVGLVFATYLFPRRRLRTSSICLPCGFR